MAHEIEHVRHKDNLVHLILNLIRAIFWWIPTQWLYDRIQEGQEVSCDIKSKKYGIDPVELASAICKSAKHSFATPQQPLTQSLTRHPTTLKRLHLLLHSPTVRFKQTRLLVNSFAFGVAFSWFYWDGFGYFESF